MQRVGSRATDKSRSAEFETDEIDAEQQSKGEKSKGEKGSTWQAESDWKVIECDGAEGDEMHKLRDVWCAWKDDSIAWEREEG